MKRRTDAWFGVRMIHSLNIKSYNQIPVQDNKQYHKEVLLHSFYLNGHTLGFLLYWQT